MLKKLALVSLYCSKKLLAILAKSFSLFTFYIFKKGSEKGSVSTDL